VGGELPEDRHCDLFFASVLGVAATEKEVSKGSLSFIELNLGSVIQYLCDLGKLP
jgi:hypothetical protein